MFSWVQTLDHAKSKSGDVTKVLTELQGSVQKRRPDSWINALQASVLPPEAGQKKARLGQPR
jgi:hypothetical protein